MQNLKERQEEMRRRMARERDIYDVDNPLSRNDEKERHHIEEMAARTDLKCLYCKKQPTKASRKTGEILPCKKCKNKQIGLSQYGLTLREFGYMLAEQEFKCAICNIEFDYSQKALSPNVDHCHLMLHVRGILCGRCNSGLGMFRDDEEILVSAIKYLQDNRIQKKR